MLARAFGSSDLLEQRPAVGAVRPFVRLDPETAATVACESEIVSLVARLPREMCRPCSLGELLYSAKRAAAVRTRLPTNELVHSP